MVVVVQTQNTLLVLIEGRVNENENVSENDLSLMIFWILCLVNESESENESENGLFLMIFLNLCFVVNANENANENDLFSMNLQKWGGNNLLEFSPVLLQHLDQFLKYHYPLPFFLEHPLMKSN